MSNLCELIDIVGEIGNLNEKLIKINSKDLNTLYKPLKPLMTELQKSLKTYSISDVDKEIASSNWKKVQQGYIVKKFSSSVLTSKKAVLAHKLNPIDIYIGVVNTNCYIPIDKMVFVGVNKTAVDALFKGEESIRFILSGPQRKHFSIEFQEHRIKSTMMHELIHWIDDTLHNFHIKKLVTKATELHSADVLKKGEKDVYLADYEINAVIHSLYNYRKEHRKIWDKLTFDDLMALTPSEVGLNKELGKSWRIKIKKRMAREGILGKKMR